VSYTLELQKPHLYYAFISDFEPSTLHHLLSLEEQQKLDKIRLAEDKNRFIVARAGLRKLLSYYLNVEHTKITIQYHPNGKPFVENNLGIHFNIAHTENLVILAFSIKNEIGVDVESLQRTFDTNKLSSFLFSEREYVQFQKLPRDVQKEAFVNCWTRKEAFLKAIGSGLTIPPQTIAVSFIPGEDAKILQYPQLNHDQKSWCLESFDIPGGYRGAVGYE
jgi:4'-phosphopantetheinyl transferase